MRSFRIWLSAARSTLAPVGCVAGIDGIAVMIFGIMYLLMLDKLRRRFGEQAMAAEMTWARLPASAPAAD